MKNKKEQKNNSSPLIPTLQNIRKLHTTNGKIYYPQLSKSSGSDTMSVRVRPSAPKGCNLKVTAFFTCAQHGQQLGGESPLRAW
jgi:hypothetical protein